LGYQQLLGNKPIEKKLAAHSLRLKPKGGADIIILKRNNLPSLYVELVTNGGAHLPGKQLKQILFCLEFA
jgi:hypothetical protein